jgi:hypothetical protein
MEPQNGLRKAAHSRHGRQQDPFYGSTENVRLYLISKSMAFVDSYWQSGLVAGSGKTILWYVSSQVRVSVAY